MHEPAPSETPTLSVPPEKTPSGSGNDDSASERTHVESNNALNEPTQDAIIVDWDGPNDPENPKK